MRVIEASELTAGCLAEPLLAEAGPDAPLDAGLVPMAEHADLHGLPRTGRWWAGAQDGNRKRTRAGGG